MTQSSTDSSLVDSLQAYIDACSGPGITLYEGHPAVLMSRARDAISTLERELEEARLAASVIEGISNELDIALTAAEAKALELDTFVPWLRGWCSIRFGKWITYKTAIAALNQLRHVAALQSEKDREGGE